jgi:hypothetical protein
MRPFETYTKRRKKLERTGQQDVYQYDELPQPFRVQVAHIWRSINQSLSKADSGRLSSYDKDAESAVWEHIYDTLARELGVFALASGSGHYYNCQRYLLEADTDAALDIIDLSFKVIDAGVRDYLDQHTGFHTTIDYGADDAINELNYRFREHSIGYEFTGGELIRIDSQYIHAEVVKPAIQLLHMANFQGAAKEFLRAHEHYRHERYKEAIAEALKAFESTMKTICKIRGWHYDEGASSKALIKIMFEKGLIPSFMEAHFAGLRTTLEAGLPTVRNKTSGHGQGSSPVVIADHIAGYALHLAATNIVFLVQAHKALK